MTEDEIPLERGYCFYYEQCREFEQRELSVAEQVAIGFEAGLQLGRSEKYERNIDGKAK